MKPHLSEIARKTVHLLSLLVPLVSYYSLLNTQLILIFFIFFYAYSEYARKKNLHFFAQPLINKLQREDEKKRFAKAPLLLAFGVLLTISFFSWKAAFIGIYLVGLGDTLASVIGRRWGKIKLFYSEEKTYLGSAVCFITALCISLYFLKAKEALLVAFVGMFFESLPWKDWDNLTVPIVTAFLAEIFLFSS